MRNKKPAEDPLGLVLEEMKPSDLDEVMAIEKVSFAVPWTRRFFERELSLQFSCSMTARCEALPGRPLAGYAVLWVVADELHILNVAVHPDFRRKGVGRRLMERVIDEGRKRDTAILILEVRRSGLAAQALYEEMGFRHLGTRKAYYSDNGEDAFVMVLQLRQRR